MNKYKIETVICKECDGEIFGRVRQIGPSLNWTGPFPNPPFYGPLHAECAEKVVVEMNEIIEATHEQK